MTIGASGVVVGVGVVWERATAPTGGIVATPTLAPNKAALKQSTKRPALEPGRKDTDGTTAAILSGIWK
jgi:hypothetical protein